MVAVKGKKRETRSSFKLASGVSTTRKRRGRIWNACSVRSHTGGREKGGKEARVRQIREEYTRRSQSFAVRLRETTVYSRVKSHTRSWISAKCLYYRNIAPVSHAGCHMVNFSQIVIAKMARTDRIDGLYFVIVFARGKHKESCDNTAEPTMMKYTKCGEMRVRESSLVCSLDAFRGLHDAANDRAVRWFIFHKDPKPQCLPSTPYFTCRIAKLSGNLSAWIINSDDAPCHLSILWGTK